MGRPGQSPLAARIDWQRAAGGVRGVVSSASGSAANGGLTEARRSPEEPGRFRGIAMEKDKWAKAIEGRNINVAG